MREQIARALADADGLDWDGKVKGTYYARHDYYLQRADAILQLMEKVAQAAIDASAECVESNPRGMFNYEDEHASAIRALSPKAIVEGVK